MSDELSEQEREAMETALGRRPVSSDLRAGYDRLAWAWRVWRAGRDAALASSGAGRTHFVPSWVEDAGREDSTACGALPLREPSSDPGRVDCLDCLRRLAALASSEAQPQGDAPTSAWRCPDCGLTTVGLGATPADAVRNLFGAIGEKTMFAHGHADDRKLERLLDAATQEDES